MRKELKAQVWKKLQTLQQLLDMVRLPRTLSSKASSLLGTSLGVGAWIPSDRHRSALGSSTQSTYMMGTTRSIIRKKKKKEKVLLIQLFLKQRWLSSFHGRTWAEVLKWRKCSARNVSTKGDGGLWHTPDFSVSPSSTNVAPCLVRWVLWIQFWVSELFPRIVKGKRGLSLGLNYIDSSSLRNSPDT